MEQQHPPILRATRKDVAKYAGTSEQTVSYILNGTRKFSPEMVDKVKEAVKVLNYQPDMIARSMVKKRSKPLCIAVNDLSNPMFGEVIRGFEELATQYGYFVNVLDVHSNFLQHASAIIARRVEGVYVSLIPSKDTDLFVNSLADAGIKVILGNAMADKCNDKVVFAEVDLYSGMRDVVDYLAAKNHEQIVYLSGLDVHSASDYRYRSFIERYQSLFGREPVVIENTPPYDTDVEDGYRLANRLFESGIPCTAMIATNDLRAFGAIKACKEHGLKVGRDIAVVGFDNIVFSDLVEPPLTTSGFDKRAYGRKLFELLNRYIETDVKPENLVVSCELVKRRSCQTL